MQKLVLRNSEEQGSYLPLSKCTLVSKAINDYDFKGLQTQLNIFLNGTNYTAKIEPEMKYGIGCCGFYISKKIIN